MIDLETLATSPNALVLTIAGIRFNYLENYSRIDSPYELDYFYCRVDTESQPTREINDDTVAWWAKQEELIQGRFAKDRPTYAQMIKFNEEQRDMFDPNEEGISCFCGD